MDEVVEYSQDEAQNWTKLQRFQKGMPDKDHAMHHALLICRLRHGGIHVYGCSVGAAYIHVQDVMTQRFDALQHNAALRFNQLVFQDSADELKTKRMLHNW